MAIGPDRRTISRADAQVADIDVGLRQYMLGVYNHMMVAMVITGLTAFGVSMNPTMIQAIYGTPLQWVVMLAPLGMVFFLSARIHHLKPATAQILFWVFSVLMGLSLSSIFLIYQGSSIARVFFITAASFGALSLYGYTTKRNLSGLGSFLFMGVIGIIIAMVVNLFLQSSMMALIISVAGVLLFAGLTAYDTQQIKNMYNELDGSDIAMKKSIMGALKLYLDFLNMFIFLMHILGVARE